MTDDPSLCINAGRRRTIHENYTSLQGASGRRLVQYNALISGQPGGEEDPGHPGVFVKAALTNAINIRRVFISSSFQEMLICFLQFSDG